MKEEEEKEEIKAGAEVGRGREGGGVKGER